MHQDAQTKMIFHSSSTELLSPWFDFVSTSNGLCPSLSSNNPILQTPIVTTLIQKHTYALTHTCRTLFSIFPNFQLPKYTNTQQFSHTHSKSQCAATPPLPLTLLMLVPQLLTLVHAAGSASARALLLVVDGAVFAKTITQV